MQGDVLAPFLFVILVDYIMTKRKGDRGFNFQPKIGTSSRGKPTSKVNDLDFADDIALLENNLLNANKQLAALRGEAAHIGLEVNAAKTEFMALNQT